MLLPYDSPTLQGLDACCRRMPQCMSCVFVRMRRHWVTVHDWFEDAERVRRIQSLCVVRLDDRRLVLLVRIMTVYKRGHPLRSLDHLK